MAAVSESSTASLFSYNWGTEKTSADYQNTYKGVIEEAQKLREEVLADADVYKGVLNEVQKLKEEILADADENKFILNKSNLVMQAIDGTFRPNQNKSRIQAKTLRDIERGRSHIQAKIITGEHSGVVHSGTSILEMAELVAIEEKPLDNMVVFLFIVPVANIEQFRWWLEINYPKPHFIERGSLKHEDDDVYMIVVYPISQICESLDRMDMDFLTMIKSCDQISVSTTHSLDTCRLDEYSSDNPTTKSTIQATKINGEIKPLINSSSRRKSFWELFKEMVQLKKKKKGVSEHVEIKEYVRES